MTEADALRTEIAGLVGALQGSRESVDSLRADLATVAAALTDERAKSAESERDYQNEHKAHADTKAALAESREQTKSALALGNHALEASRAETAAAQARIAELEAERDTACADRDFFDRERMKTVELLDISEGQRQTAETALAALVKAASDVAANFGKPRSAEREISLMRLVNDHLRKGDDRG